MIGSSRLIESHQILEISGFTTAKQITTSEISKMVQLIKSDLLHTDSAYNSEQQKNVLVYKGIR